MRDMRCTRGARCAPGLPRHWSKLGELVSRRPETFELSRLKGRRAPLPAVETPVAPQGAPKFGDALEHRRRALLAIAGQMRAVLPATAQPFVNDLASHLERLSCRIAVIGQVKAGKSTFVNAFTGRASLLPTDINPWTTAVTRLHFGVGDRDPNAAAEFTFFDVAEWDHIWTGGGRLRELTERFVPGFEPELLRQHVTELRRRAEQRLGNSLHSLLGQVHSYPELTSDLLAQYVCAGTISADMAITAPGHYSDIVKAADLNFESRDFAFPTTIVDTPGTNDPFLVRDEITRRALETADIHIVVLMARQALSSADVALLRILRGLHKDRIVVFVNRLDELGDLVSDAPAVLEQVNEGLEREFPGSKIPVIAGSALWATFAAEGSEQDMAQFMSPELRAYAAQRLGIRPSDASEPGTTLSEILYTCSGLPALTRELARLSLEGHASHVISQVADSLLEVGQVSLASAKQERSALDDAQNSDSSFEQSIDEELRVINARVEQTERLLQSLNSFMLDVQNRTAQVAADSCDSLQEELTGVVEYAASVESDKLRRALAHGQSGGVWQCETGAVRRLLETKLLASFSAAESDLWSYHESVLPQLHRLMTQCGTSAPVGSQIDRQRDTAQPPSMAALSQFVSLDLNEPVWKRWLSNSRTPDDRATELGRLIRQEFMPIVNTLVDTTRTRLEQIQSTVVGDMTRNFVFVAESLQEQSRATLDRMQQLIEARTALSDGRISENRRARIRELDAQINDIAPLIAALRAERDGWRGARAIGAAPQRQLTTDD